jgi:pimeloyl-ACP methyl ester carboxylesterase
MSVELAIHDFGGPEDGPGIVLLHGFGGDASHWKELAPLLTDRFRVVAPDLRCHGGSGDGPWSWDALADDVAQVVGRLSLDRPAVVGHSLGGGVAALWAANHPECPGVVDLDGTRAVETVPENYPGLDPAIAQAQLAELTATFEAQAAAMARDESVRPGAEAVAAFRGQMMRVDLLEVFAAARCPLLICAATRGMPGTEPFADLLEAHRRGVARDLAAAARANPLVRVEHVAASHDMVREIPAELAALIRTFLT